MSRLIEMLDKTQSASEAIGFAASRRSAANPSIALIGRATAGELADNPALADAPADAVLVTLDASDAAAVGRVSAALKNAVWGARVGSVSAADARALKDAGCDFIVFDAEDTAAAALNDGDIGKILAFDPETPDFSEDAARAVRTLDIDGALFTPPDGLLPLTVQRLLNIQAARALVRRRSVLTAPTDLAAPDLEALRNAGIVGLVVSLAAADLARMRDAIAGLPRRRSPRGGRGTAQAPAAGFARNAPPDDDDDFDDYE